MSNRGKALPFIQAGDFEFENGDLSPAIQSCYQKPAVIEENPTAPYPVALSVLAVGVWQS